jgi:hypothetical protein
MGAGVRLLLVQSGHVVRIAPGWRLHRQSKRLLLPRTKSWQPADPEDLFLRGIGHRTSLLDLLVQRPVTEIYPPAGLMGHLDLFRPPDRTSSRGSPRKGHGLWASRAPP